MKRLISRMAEFMRFQQSGEKITALFFGLLIVGLFLGDGKQGVIDVYGATVVLVLWFLRMVYVPVSVSSPDRPILRAWGAVFLLSAVTALFSDSIGYSVTWLIRFTSAYLLYRLFYDLSNQKVVRRYMSGLFVLTAVATVTSVVLWMFPRLDSWLPSMNLVGMQFGHNHLADLLVLIAPSVFLMSSAVSVGVCAGIYGGFVAVLLLTKARASWALVYSYVLLHSYSLPKGPNRTKLLFSLLGFLVVGLLYGNSIADARPASLTVRTQYWRQAVEGFISRPLVGYGPGTFSLLAVHTQRFGESVSWFAHSQILQILAESGLIGMVAFLALWGVHVRMWILNTGKRAVSKEVAALASGVVLCFVYSMFDYVLDYFVIWMLFWACAGVIAGVVDGFPKPPSRSAVPVGALVFVCVFYVVWITGNGLGFLAKKYDTAFLVAPFDVVLAHLYMTRPDHNITETGIGLVWFFHRGNPEMLYRISLHRRLNGDDDEADRLMRRAVILNPQDMPLVKEYLSVLARKAPESAGQDIIELMAKALPDIFRQRVLSLSGYGPEIGRAVKSLDTKQPVRLREQYVSLLYVIGLETLEDDPELTLRLWELARDIHPDFAATHIEISRLFAHVFKWPVSAGDALRYCARFPSARGQCSGLFGKPLLPPGDFYDALN